MRAPAASPPSRGRSRSLLVAPTLTCAASFRLLARGCLADVLANRSRASKGEANAVHQMRIAITRFRATAAFFLPLLSDQRWPRLKKELRWLNRALGAARDLDVALQYLRKQRQRQSGAEQKLARQRVTAYQGLARTLQSTRFDRLTKQVSTWVESEQWSVGAKKRTATLATDTVGPYCQRRTRSLLAKRVKQGQTLETMSESSRHRLRIRMKRLRYMLDAFAPTLAADHPSRFRKVQKNVRDLQRLLGQLRDIKRLQSMIPAHDRPSATVTRKREAQLLHEATKIYRALAAIKSL